MPEYTATEHVSASAQNLFDYLSDVGNLPKYFDRMTSASPTQGEAVDTTARMPDGTEVQGEAWFRVSKDNQSLAWGSQGDNDYHGHLEVTADGDTSSSVAVTISTERVATDEIQRGLEETVANIKRLCEG